MDISPFPIHYRTKRIKIEFISSSDLARRYFNIRTASQYTFHSKFLRQQIGLLERNCFGAIAIETNNTKMAKLTLALTTALVASTSAFAPASSSAKTSTALAATGFEEVGGKAWDPLSLGKLEDANDTFPNMFPKSQFLQEAEIKHGRMSMLAWTGVWATHVVSVAEMHEKSCAKFDPIGVYLGRRTRTINVGR
jgi:hypothetical protein